MHGYTSDPPVLLEDFLHISLHYLERVQVPNKNPESENEVMFQALPRDPKKRLNTKLLSSEKSRPAIDGLRILTACLVSHLAHVHLDLFLLLFLYLQIHLLLYFLTCKNLRRFERLLSDVLYFLLC